MLRINGKSWKTTSAGILLIASAIIGIYFKIKNVALDEVSVIASLTSIIGGIGLLFSKDGDVTNTTP